jgi:peptide/nickel transport system ATP-binding protein
MTGNGLKMYFPTKKGIIKAVDDVDFEMKKGEVLGVVGESGSGKTTLGNMIMGIYPPTSGNIEFRGIPLPRSAKDRPVRLKRDIQMVFQNPASSLNPRRTVKQALEVPLKVGGEGKTTKQSVGELLNLVDLPTEYADRYPEELGGGEKQLVAIARALATDPSLLVLDEPTSALDVSIQAKIINVLMRMKDRLELSYVFITHNLSLMRNVADRVMIMYLGKVREVAATEEFFKNPLHPYTRMLLSSIPVVTEAEEAMKPQKTQSVGEIAGALDLPTGCSFHPRCQYVTGICNKVDPPLLEVAPKHLCNCHLYPKSIQEAAPQ